MRVTLNRFAGGSAGACNARRAWLHRCGILLEIDLDGRQGLGEASPLPGFSSDTIDSAAAALATLDPRKLERALERPRILDALRTCGRLVPHSQPAARMALETAALDWRARCAGVSAAALLGAPPHAARPLAQLLDPVDAAHAKAAECAGFRHFKIKLGAPGAIASELAAASALRRALGVGSRLRLDVNRSWTVRQARSACLELRALAVEFIEEPLQTWSHPLETDIALALDESLRGCRAEDLERLVRRTGARVVVLKPMLLGGLTGCLELGGRALALGLGVVISHCFDGPVALIAASAIALALPTARAQGLAPHAGLAAWPAVPLPIVGATLESWTRAGLGITHADLQ
jgi:o-succinylbenzoate synthase